MANFHKYRDLAVRTVDELMGETLRIVPLDGGRADATRTPREVISPLRVGVEENDGVSGKSKSWGSRIASGKARAHISRTEYPDLLVRQGDRLRAVERAGQPWFEVDAVGDRDHARIIVALVEI